MIYLIEHFNGKAVIGNYKSIDKQIAQPMPNCNIILTVNKPSMGVK